jgi:hypothetical protein
MSDCCQTICNKIAALSQAAQDAFSGYWWKHVDPLLRWVSGYAGQYVTLPPGPEVPTFGDMMSRITGGLDDGFALWQWYNQSQPGKASLTLPEAPAKPTRVSLNGAMLASPRDYSIAGTTLTFATGLQLGDLVLLKSYGA